LHTGSSDNSNIELDKAYVEFKLGPKSGSILSAITSKILFKDEQKHSTSRKFAALSDVTLAINSGERVGIVGSNGAGKSTLLRALSGIYEPTSGSISIYGGVVSLIDIALGIDHEATGLENIYLRGAFLGLSKEQVRGRLDEIISFSELEDFLDMPVRTYSTGMQMRLGFSVATVLSPDILIMDEWLSVGDEKFRKKAEIKLNELVDQSKILILASHSRHLLETTCSRAIWLEKGRVKMDATVGAVCSAYFG
jgi:lipopolysaccharide transport system ATP-binding protein